MTRTKQSRPILLRVISVLIVLSGFAAFMLSTYLLPFVNVLPYLQIYPFEERLIWSAIFYLSVCVAARVGCTSQQWQRIKKLTMADWKDSIGVLLGIVMAICVAAWLSANIFGSFVKIFPGDYYEASFEITATVSSGSKYRSVDLNLKSLQDEQVFYLTLSKRLFDYPKFQVGETLLLKGKQNIFGVYVEDYKVAPARINGVAH